jgi:hypothetical protein
MEMYGGESLDNAQFHTRGLVGTPRIQEWIEVLAGRVFVTMCTTLIVAKRCDSGDVIEQLDGALRQFSEATGVGQGDPNRLLDKLKKK